jgi:hypothetical protein
MIERFMSVVSFLSSYPTWVKTVFLFWALVSAVLIASLVFAKPSDPRVQKGDAKVSTIPRMLLSIDSVEVFGGGGHSEIQIDAQVNGNSFRYPGLGGVQWVGVGPQMSPGQFHIPFSENGYEISFTARLRGEGSQQPVELISQRVVNLTAAEAKEFSGSYDLHKKLELSRAPGVSAVIRFSVRDLSR